MQSETLKKGLADEARIANEIAAQIGGKVVSTSASRGGSGVDAAIESNGETKNYRIRRRGQAFNAVIPGQKYDLDRWGGYQFNCRDERTYGSDGTFTDVIEDALGEKRWAEITPDKLEEVKKGEKYDRKNVHGNIEPFWNIPKDWYQPFNTLN